MALLYCQLLIFSLFLLASPFNAVYSVFENVRAGVLVNLVIRWKRKPWNPQNQCRVKTVCKVLVMHFINISGNGYQRWCIRHHHSHLRERNRKKCCDFSTSCWTCPNKRSPSSYSKCTMLVRFWTCRLLAWPIFHPLGRSGLPIMKKWRVTADIGSRNTGFRMYLQLLQWCYELAMNQSKWGFKTFLQSYSGKGLGWSCGAWKFTSINLDYIGWGHIDSSRIPRSSSRLKLKLCKGQGKDNVGDKSQDPFFGLNILVPFPGNL